MIPLKYFYWQPAIDMWRQEIQSKKIIYWQSWLNFFSWSTSVFLHHFVFEYPNWRQLGWINYGAVPLLEYYPEMKKNNMQQYKELSLT